ncbi:hypothetical protein BGX26_000795 [Mortierella sp. AD094]|nr:hypothetical protein BGX26_000795 [Mortierella sp. AD094]
MDTATLQRIAQWERTYAKGNKKPITTREYPPLRPRKDIVLQDIKPLPLIRKGSQSEPTESVSLKVEPAEKNITAVVSPSTDNNASKALKEAPTRKAYYESWDKFDVDSALEDIDAKGDKSKQLSENAPYKQTKKADVKATPKFQEVDPVAANAEKEKGNEFFKKSQYQKAIEHYSASMALDPSNSVLPINRAMALLKLERFVEAERDCTLGLKLDSKNVKALWRRGIARRSLGKVDEAKNDFESALKIDPANKAVKEELAKLQQKQPEKPKASTPPTTTTKQSTVPTTKKVEPKAPTSSPAKDTAPPQIISSKRVLIKEVENDQDSALFTPSAIKKSAVSVDNDQSTPTVAPLVQPSTSPASSKLTVSPSTVPSGSQSPTATTDTPYTSTPPAISASPSVASTNNVQMIAPKTTLDFQRDWKSYSKKTELLYNYIKLIQPESLPALFKSSFESDYLSSMLTVFREFYIQSEEPQLLYSSLLNLAKVQRFDMTLMFMSGTDKKDLVAIFQYLSGHLNDQALYSQQDLAALASKFKTTNY